MILSLPLKSGILIAFVLLVMTLNGHTQVIPNNGMETWINHGQYDDPQYWDTPNQETCIVLFLFTKVVTKSTDSHSGSYSARLESKELPLIGITVPGVITLGSLSIDITNQTYSMTGGVPIDTTPSHLTGFFKYQPKGGDSCAIGILLTKWIPGTGRDTVGIGYFSTRDTVTSWTPFSAWIDYRDQSIPDTMNIVALSSARYDPIAGTVLFIDDLSVDFITGLKEDDPAKGIKICQDFGQSQLGIFFDFPVTEFTSVGVFNALGSKMTDLPSGNIRKGFMQLDYSGYSPGLYILNIVHGNKKFTRKFIFNL